MQVHTRVGTSKHKVGGKRLVQPGLIKLTGGDTLKVASKICGIATTLAVAIARGNLTCAHTHMTSCVPYNKHTVSAALPPKKVTTTLFARVQPISLQWRCVDAPQKFSPVQYYSVNATQLSARVVCNSASPERKLTFAQQLWSTAACSSHTINSPPSR